MQANRSARSPRPVSVCSFTFADGRQCRLPRLTGHPYLCLFQAKKEAQILSGEQAGQDIANFLSATTSRPAMSPNPWHASSPP